MLMASVYSFLGAGLTAAVLLFALVLGAVFGSFITCVAGRLVSGENPWKGRSHCDSCGSVLAPRDLIPVISWLVGRGRCRFCKSRIPLRCLNAELGLGLVFALLFLHFGLGVHTLAYCALACVLLGLSLMDLDTMTIPNGFVLAGVVIWLLQVVGFAALELGGQAGWIYSLGQTPAALQVNLFPALGDSAALALNGLVGGFAMGGGMLVLSLVFDALAKQQSLGGGDVKLLFVTGLFLGLPLSLLNLILACILGLAFAFVRRCQGKQGAFPFGPAISLATLITLLVGNVAMSAYLSLIF